MPLVLTKEKVVVEDMELSMDSSVDQERGTLTPFNAAYLPYTSSQSVTDGLDERYTRTEADNRFAEVNGNSAYEFNVAAGIDASHAVNKDQLDTIYNQLDGAKVDQGTVLRTDIDNPTYTPQYDNSPATKKYIDDAIADKFLGAVTGTFIAEDTSGNAITIKVTNGVVTQIG
jgi:hypothetical protein